MNKYTKLLSVTLSVALGIILIGAYIWYDPFIKDDTVSNEVSNISRPVGGKIIHLSIDDVESLFDLQHSEKYPTLFDHPFYSYLKSMHDKYGIKITLYTYAHLGKEKIGDIPQKYKEDFKENSGWLRIGYHWIRPEFNNRITVKDFEKGYKEVEDAVYNFADSSVWSKTLRLHYFFAPDSLRNTLHNTNTLLCADDADRESYDLAPSENRLVQINGIIRKNNVKYIRTDLRLENKIQIKRYLKEQLNKDTLVIFTHEWALTPQSFPTIVRKILTMKPQLNFWTRHNLEQTLEWVKEHDYNYSFLE